MQAAQTADAALHTFRCGARWHTHVGSDIPGASLSECESVVLYVHPEHAHAREPPVPLLVIFSCPRASEKESAFTHHLYSDDRLYRENTQVIRQGASFLSDNSFPMENNIDAKSGGEEVAHQVCRSSDS